LKSKTEGALPRAFKEDRSQVNAALCCHDHLVMPGIPEFTKDLRSGDEPIFERLRALLAARGVDPSTTWLVDLFEDDVNFEFGLILTGDRRVYQIGYRYPDGEVGGGELTEWVDLTHSWRLTPYRDEIDDAFDYLEASA
jgi:hypothetical protein